MAGVVAGTQSACACVRHRVAAVSCSTAAGQTPLGTAWPGPVALRLSVSPSAGRRPRSQQAGFPACSCPRTLLTLSVPQHPTRPCAEKGGGGTGATAAAGARSEASALEGQKVVVEARATEVSRLPCWPVTIGPSPQSPDRQPAVAWVTR